MHRWRTLFNCDSGKSFDRRGFAIVLVAALAGLVFLLGASLVVTSQLQSAASQYDQRMRLARENALAALDIAVGDLQRFAGRDKAVTFLADALRADLDRDFDDPSDPATSKLFHPFWVGAYDPDNAAGVRWLVTHPLGTEVAAPSPTVPIEDGESEDVEVGVSDTVVLVGAGTALPANPGSQQNLFDVQAPREPIVVSGVPGYSSDVTVGHVAYWVGDLGMKASYALRDKTSQVVHGVYATVSNGSRDRLRQMRSSHPDLDISSFNPNSGNNVPRIDSMVNDFQFRSPSYPTTGHDSAYLDGLYINSVVRRHFHDFTPLSRGLPTNTATGGLKQDLSARLPIGNAIYDTYLLPFVSLPFSNRVQSAGDPLQVKFLTGGAQTGTGTSPAIYPFLSQFNFNGSFYVEKLASNPTAGELRFSYNASFEFWNPYSSTLLEATSNVDYGSGNSVPIAFKIVIDGLPTVTLGYETAASSHPDFTVDLGDLSSLTLLPAVGSPVAKPTFAVPASGDWKPGVIKIFSGPDSQNAATNPLLLSAGSAAQEAVDRKVVLVNKPESVFIDDTEDTVEDRIRSQFASADISVHLYEASAEVGETPPIATFSAPSGTFTLSEASVGMYEVGFATFGFSWELGADDEQDSPLPFDANFHPQKPLLNLASLNFDPDARNGLNLSMTFNSALDVVLGYNPSAQAREIPGLELPRQEVVSLANLAHVYYESELPWKRIGEPGAPANHLYDTAFFSTIPHLSIGPPNPPFPLGNIRIRNATVTELQSVASAQHVIQDGAFNVNSTSIRAWAAVLKGIQLESWGEEGGALSIVNSLLAGLGLNPDAGSVKRYQFFNYPQSAQETHSGFFEDLLFGDLRRSYRQGVVSLNEDQVDALAAKIVEGIRNHHKTAQRPFLSLREFLDSAVIETAIQVLGLNPESVAPQSPGFLSQSAILNAIGPFLSARSDTFLIRAYGDATNPADPTDVWAAAYCEAVVQRVWEKHPTDGSSSLMTPTATGAGRFGRQYKIVAFRWLTPDEI